MRNFIGDNINALRINKGCSQAKFAKISGVSQSSISAWERGESVPQSHHVQAIIDAFPDLTPDDILSEELGYAKRLILSPYIRKEDVIRHPFIRIHSSRQANRNAYLRRTLRFASFNLRSTQRCFLS